MAHSAGSVRAELVGGVLLLALEDPTGIPRLTRRVIGNLLERIEIAQREAAVQALVITGTEQCFAAGAHLAEVAALQPAEALSFSAQGQSLMNSIERSRRPVVAAIRGHCLGGGMDLALACHLRVAGEDAVFGHPGGSLGIITGWGGTQRLPRLIGRARALEMLVTGRSVTVREARAWGLVNRLVPPETAVQTALDVARGLAARNNL